MKNLIAILFITSSIFLQNAASADGCIGAILASTGPYWKQVENGVKAGAAELGIEKVIIRGAADESSIQHQQRLIEYMVDQKCTSLIIAPHQGITNEHLKEIGAPVVAIDRDTKADVKSVIKSNNFEAGKLAAIEMSKALGDKRRVAIFRFSKDVPSTTLRAEGFLEGAKESGLEVVDDIVLGTQVGKVKANYRNWLEKGTQVDGAFTVNEKVTTGVLLTLEGDPNGAKGAIIIGFDFNPIYADMINSSLLHGVVVQNPHEMGRLGINSIKKVLNNEEISKRIDVPVSFVNKNNIQDPEIKNIIGLD